MKERLCWRARARELAKGPVCFSVLDTYMRSLVALTAQRVFHASNCTRWQRVLNFMPVIMHALAATHRTLLCGYPALTAAGTAHSPVSNMSAGFTQYLRLIQQHTPR